MHLFNRLSNITLIFLIIVIVVIVPVHHCHVVLWGVIVKVT